MMGSQFALFDLAPSLEGVDAAALSSTYSADRIGTNSTIKKPLSFGGHLWVSVGGSNDSIKAYRVVQLRDFEGKPTTYHEKGAHDGYDSARRDPLGFYHGMVVTQGGTKYAMLGPEFRVNESAFLHFDSPADDEEDEDEEDALCECGRPERDCATYDDEEADHGDADDALRVRQGFADGWLSDDEEDEGEDLDDGGVAA